jgi:hypothetical protein
MAYPSIHSTRLRAGLFRISILGFRIWWGECSYSVALGPGGVSYVEAIEDSGECDDCAFARISVNR